LAERDETIASSTVESKRGLTTEAVVITIIGAASQNNAFARAAQDEVSDTAALTSRIIKAASIVLDANSIGNVVFGFALGASGIYVSLAIGVDWEALPIIKQKVIGTIGASIDSKSQAIGD
jgi:hypothetical protein